jgi:nitrogen fixation protein FixH
VHRGKGAPPRRGAAGHGDRAARGGTDGDRASRGSADGDRTARGSATGSRNGNGNGNGNGHRGRGRAETAVLAGAGRAPWPDSERMGVSLRKLRWSVAAETVIAATVLAVTAILVNTPTGRESYSPPVVATASFNTGAPGGSGSISITVTPDIAGPNQFRLVVTGRNGKPYRPRQIQAGLVMPAKNIGPLAIRLARTGPGRYLGGPTVVSTSGQWQLRVTIRSDAFDETTVVLPFAVR